jgi:hypothetical protein
MSDFIQNYPALSIFFFLFFLGFIYSVLSILFKVIKKENITEPTFSKLLTSNIKDLPSLLTFGIVSTIIVLVLSKLEVPDILISAFFIIIGFYILARKPQAFKPGDEWHPKRSGGQSSLWHETPAFRPGSFHFGQTVPKPRA